MSAASLLAAWLTLASPPADPPSPAPSAATERTPRDVYELDDAAFVAQARRDLETLRQGTEGLRRLRDEAFRSKALYRRDQDVPYTPDEKQLLVSTWAAFFDCFVSTEVVRQRYWDFLKVPALTQPKKHAWGFLLTHAALAAELAQGMAFTDLAGSQKQLEVLLNEPGPEYGLPARAFSRFKEKVVHVGTSTQLFTGDGYRATLHPVLSKSGVLNEPGVPALFQAMREDSRAARSRLLKRGPVLFAKAAKDLTQDTTARAVFPVQKTVAEWMGDTRVHRSGRPLISREQVLALLPRMAPGDVMVARQNWFLSNIGLPGFWPHAELYVGTSQELSQAFDAEPGVKAWVATLPGRPETFTGHLAKAFPAKWAEYTRPDAHGDPVRIIESISEGVSFTGVEHGMHVDYLGVLRPRLSPVDKARAILRAFTFQGRPYDFNFDFFSDQSLVCTELVWKSYAPSKDQQGLNIPLVSVAGRRTLPANEIVRVFDAEYGQPGRQFDFVAFLDGREAQGDAVEANAEVFRYTYRRMKWDIAQE